MARTNMVFDPGPLGQALSSFNNEVRAFIAATMEYHADRGAAWMKENAPWTDQTGNARQGLSAQAFAEHGGVDVTSTGATVRAGGTYGIVFFHQVPYGIWLEVKHEGRDAVILPAIEHESPEVMVTLSTLMAAVTAKFGG